METNLKEAKCPQKIFPDNEILIPRDKKQIKNWSLILLFWKLKCSSQLWSHEQKVEHKYQTLEFRGPNLS